MLGLWRAAEYREERYAAIELTGVRQAAAFQAPAAMAMYEEMIVSGAWWDYVDSVAAQRVGPIVAGFPGPMKRLMRQWSRCDNMWKRRTSILCQLGAKGSTDLKLLYDCIEPSLREKEFFLRKAIGWSFAPIRLDGCRGSKSATSRREADCLSPLSKKAGQPGGHRARRSASLKNAPRNL